MIETSSITPETKTVTPAAPTEPEIKLIKMIRSLEDAALFKGPVTADVHPDEVQNYAMGGFHVVEKKEK